LVLQRTGQWERSITHDDLEIFLEKNKTQSIDDLKHKLTLTLNKNHADKKIK